MKPNKGGVQPMRCPTLRIACFVIAVISGTPSAASAQGGCASLKPRLVDSLATPVYLCIGADLDASWGNKSVQQFAPSAAFATQFSLAAVTVQIAPAYAHRLSWSRDSTTGGVVRNVNSFTVNIPIRLVRLDQLRIAGQGVGRSYWTVWEVVQTIKFDEQKSDEWVTRSVFGPWFYMVGSPYDTADRWRAAVGFQGGIQTEVNEATPLVDPVTTGVVTIDINAPIRPRQTVTFRTAYIPQITDLGNFRLETAVAVTFRIGDRFQIGPTLDWEYDSAPPAGRERSDLRLKANVRVLLFGT